MNFRISNWLKPCIGGGVIFAFQIAGGMAWLVSVVFVAAILLGSSIPDLYVAWATKNEQAGVETNWTWFGYRSVFRVTTPQPEGLVSVAVGWLLVCGAGAVAWMVLVPFLGVERASFSGFGILVGLFFVGVTPCCDTAGGVASNALLKLDEPAEDFIKAGLGIAVVQIILGGLFVWNQWWFGIVNILFGCRLIVLFLLRNKAVLSKKVFEVAQHEIVGVVFSENDDGSWIVVDEEGTHQATDVERTADFFEVLYSNSDSKWFHTVDWHGEDMFFGPPQIFSQGVQGWSDIEKN